MIILDSGVFPNIQMKVNRSGASLINETRKVVNAALGNYRSIEALCAAPPEALAHSPSQMPLSCPVAPASQREMHKDGGGGGGGVAMRARAARAPKPKSCATSCGTPSATPSATAPRP